MQQQLSINEFEQEQKERINNLSEVKEEVKQPKLTREEIKKKIKEEEINKQIEEIQIEIKEISSSFKQKFTEENLNEIDKLITCYQELWDLLPELEKFNK